MMRRRWTHIEILSVLARYADEGPIQLAKELNRSEDSVSSLAHRYGTRMTDRREPRLVEMMAAVCGVRMVPPGSPRRRLSRDGTAVGPGVPDGNSLHGRHERIETPGSSGDRASLPPES